MRRTTVAGIHPVGQRKRVEDDLTADGMGVGQPVAFLGKVGQHHIRPQFAHQPRKAAHSFFGDPQHGVVGPKKVDFLDAE